jgi:hypothetical protein
MNQLPYYQTIFENSMISKIQMDAVAGLQEFQKRQILILQGFNKQKAQIFALFSLD